MVVIDAKLLDEGISRSLNRESVRAEDAKALPRDHHASAGGSAPLDPGGHLERREMFYDIPTAASG